MSNIDGCLNIGINDNGYLEGVPFYGELNESILKQYIRKIKCYIRGYKNNNPNNIVI
jgi:hypothetical protein